MIKIFNLKYTEVFHIHSSTIISMVVVCLQIDDITGDYHAYAHAC